MTTFTDIRDYRSFLVGARIDLVLTDGGAFSARLTRVELPGLCLFHIRETIPRVAFVTLALGKVVVAFPTSFNSPQFWAGVALGPRDLLLQGSGEGAHQRTMGSSRWGFIIVATKDLASYARTLTGRDIDLRYFAGTLRPPGTAAASLRRLHAKVCRLAESNPRIITHLEVVRALQDELFHALVNCLTIRDTPAWSAADRCHMSIMAKFEATLATHYNRQLSTRELRSMMGVSERTLRMCCAKFLGMGPSSYVRLRRLNLARAALSQTTRIGAKIADIARRYGFTEPGRFSAAYRAAFDETPLTTLRAAHAKISSAAGAETA